MLSKMIGMFSVVICLVLWGCGDDSKNKSHSKTHQPKQSNQPIHWFNIHGNLAKDSLAKIATCAQTPNDSNCNIITKIDLTHVGIIGTGSHFKITDIDFAKTIAKIKEGVKDVHAIQQHIFFKNPEMIPLTQTKFFVTDQNKTDRKYTVAYFIKNNLPYDINLYPTNSNDTTCKNGVIPSSKSCIVAHEYIYSPRLQNSKKRTQGISLVKVSQVSIPTKMSFQVLSNTIPWNKDTPNIKFTPNLYHAENKVESIPLIKINQVSIPTKISVQVLPNAIPWNKDTPNIKLMPITIFSVKSKESKGYISYDFKVTNSTGNKLTINNNELKLKGDFVPTLWGPSGQPPQSKDEQDFIGENNCTNISNGESCTIHYLLPIPETTTLKTFFANRSYYDNKLRLLYTPAGKNQHYLSDEFEFIFRQPTQYILSKTDEMIQPVQCTTPQAGSTINCKPTADQLTDNHNKYFDIVLDHNTQQSYIVLDTQIERCHVQYNGELQGCKKQDLSGLNIYQFKDITWDFKNEQVFVVTKNSTLQTCSINHSPAQTGILNHCETIKKSGTTPILDGKQAQQILLNKTKNDAYVVGKESSHKVLYHCKAANTLSDCKKMTLYYNDKYNHSYTFDKISFAYDYNQLLFTSSLNDKYLWCDFDLSDDQKLMCKESSEILYKSVDSSSTTSPVTLKVSSIEMDDRNLNEFLYIKSTTMDTTKVYQCEYQPNLGMSHCHLYLNGELGSQTHNYYGSQTSLTPNWGGLLISSKVNNVLEKIDSPNTNKTHVFETSLKNIGNQPITINPADIKESIINQQVTPITIEKTGCYNGVTLKTLNAGNTCTLSYSINLPKLGNSWQKFSYNYLKLTDQNGFNYPYLPIQYTVYQNEYKLTINSNSDEFTMDTSHESKTFGQGISNFNNAVTLKNSRNDTKKMQNMSINWSIKISQDNESEKKLLNDTHWDNAVKLRFNGVVDKNHPPEKEKVTTTDASGKSNMPVVYASQDPHSEDKKKYSFYIFACVISPPRQKLISVVSNKLNAIISCLPFECKKDCGIFGYIVNETSGCFECKCDYLVSPENKKNL